MKVLNVVGARPNFMKIAPLIREMRKHPGITPLLVHTGQHYDVKMAGQFFEDLQIPLPDVSLDVGSGTHAVQTAEVMKRMEPILERERPDLVLVVGDVNSTMAAALTAVKLHIPVAHVEAGLRSGDRSMPEEINRIVTDAVSDYLFVTEESGTRNLMAEGVPKSKVFEVGNVMIDSLEASRRLWGQSTILTRLGLQRSQYAVTTLHRPSNVDNMTILRGLVESLLEVGRRLPVIFPIHPRTKKALEAMGELGPGLYFGPPPTPVKGVHCMDPIGYLDFMSLVANARLVLTDSGGIQEETTVLGVPCLTLRENTERPVTVTHGTNRVIGSSPKRILEETGNALDLPVRSLPPPPLWDGHASERIVRVLQEQIKLRQVA
ncbi:MAG: UDP-N-acetylglucosamine 2-epimerase (non-hydrolyzing) [Nitrospiraceae bacterium]|nr:UDP-N-acetylglucosamine 2-epimerase (non-hydrolyzing) [Nitrospiraceae bacterium]